VKIPHASRDVPRKLQLGSSNGDRATSTRGAQRSERRAHWYAAEPDQLGTASSFQIQINLGDIRPGDDE
jgi:hypothetical protein